MIWLSCFKLKTTYSSKQSKVPSIESFHGFTPQHPRHFPLCLDPRRLTSCHRNHLNSLGIQGKKGGKWPWSWNITRGFGCFFCFFWGEGKILRLNWRNFEDHFPNVWEIPSLLLVMFLVFQIIQPLGFWMLFMWRTNLLSYLSARTKDCQGQKSQSDEGHKSWRNHNLLEDRVMSRG